jgi:hypothetical protein
MLLMATFVSSTILLMVQESGRLRMIWTVLLPKSLRNWKRFATVTLFDKTGNFSKLNVNEQHVDSAFDEIIYLVSFLPACCPVIREKIYCRI